MLKIFRTNIAYAIGSTARSAALFLLIPYFVNALSTDEYGIWALLEVGILLLTMTFLSGLDVGLMREYWFLDSDQERKRLSGTILFSMVVWGAILTTTFLLLASFLKGNPQTFGSWLPADFTFTILSLTVWTAYVESLFAFISTILRIREQAIEFMVLAVGRMLLFLAASILGVYLGYGVTGAIAGRLAAAVVGLIVSFAMTKHLIEMAFDWQYLRRVIRYGLPLLPTNLASYILFASDRYLLNIFSSLETVAIYSFTYKLATTLEVIVTRPFSLDWAPRRFKIATQPNPREAYIQALLIYLFLALGFGLLIIASAPAVYRWFVPDIYRPGLTVLPIVLAAYVAYGLSYPLNVGILLKDRTEYLPAIGWLSAGLCLALNFWWIPRFGMAGAAWATLISYTFWTGCITIVSLKLYPIHYPVRSLLTLVLAALGAYGGILAVEQLVEVILLALSLKVLWIFLVMTGLGYFIWRDTFKLIKLKLIKLKRPSRSIVAESDQ